MNKLHTFEVYLGTNFPYVPYDLVPLGLKNFLNVADDKLEDLIIEFIESHLDDGCTITESPRQITEMIRFCKQHQELGACLLAYTKNDLEGSNYLLNERYYCEIDNLENFKNQIFNESVVIAEECKNQVDYETTVTLHKDAHYEQHYFMLWADQKQYIFKRLSLENKQKCTYPSCLYCI